VSFVEINLFGVYVAPLSLMMVAAYGVLFALRRLAARRGWFAAVWHPGLFEFALYVIILSGIVLIVGGLHVPA
jgi:protein AaeX